MMHGQQNVKWLSVFESIGFSIKEEQNVSFWVQDRCNISSDILASTYRKFLNRVAYEHESQYLQPFKARFYFKQNLLKLCAL